MNITKILSYCHAHLYVKLSVSRKLIRATTSHEGDPKRRPPLWAL